MTELEKSQKSQKRQLDAAQKLVESYDKQVKDLKAKLALSDSKFKALARNGIVFSSYSDLKRAAKVYQSKHFWLIDDDSLELYELNTTTKQLKQISSYTIKSLAW